MGITYRGKKKLNKNTWVNTSGSGASLSKKFGPVTVNSRGGVWVNLPGGLTYRGRWKK
ncbi:DUF4236 domain-containing protein [Corynebacterium genitalium ATCC 33030]|uniref:DUF4236 domain-containing protein n=1 Tax=Corynebacterium genitalium ATCC 33030 TaxID=585529 RepID=D7WA02_9CORY|nr:MULTISPECIES: DUF4236 domain-containing protein [Corynebacterium]MCQ4619215.1 hypothetical protein [Corynebacterium pseudogenitalium]EFK55619.1 hypothetical protein HMPREF0291_10877 [Corynebacterium genitalium ATCC 33030]MCQ4621261.1 hypothetical protein [Corynebacterium sp. CCUG 71335]MCQ4623581.1 hypothetical protein [Corynebacterium sp. CCUG 70398]MCQ4625379.1 hypothetical protein [Corynebacterium sp. CCUG 69979]